MSLRRLLHCVGGLNQGLRGWHKGIGHITYRIKSLKQCTQYISELSEGLSILQVFKINEKT